MHDIKSWCRVVFDLTGKGLDDGWRVPGVKVGGESG